MGIQIWLLFLIISVITMSISCQRSQDEVKPLGEKEQILNIVSIDAEQLLPPHKFEVVAKVESNKYAELDKLQSKYIAQNNGLGCGENEVSKIVEDKFDKNPKVMDPALKVGDTFESHSVFSDSSSSGESQSTTTLTSIQGNKVVYGTVYSDVKSFRQNVNLSSDVIDSLFTGKPHKVTTHKDLSEQEDDVHNYTANYLETIKKLYPSLKDGSENWECRIEDSKEFSTIKSEIKYQIQGRFIPAMMEEYTTSGEIKCRKYQRTDSNSSDSSSELKEISSVTLGHGTKKNISISSKAAKSVYLAECRGRRLYNSNQLKFEDRVIEAYAERLEKVPLR
jgi:hypothetical protein